MYCFIQNNPSLSSKQKGQSFDYPLRTPPPIPPLMGDSLAGRQLKRCDDLLRHLKGLGALIVSTPYPHYVPVPLTQAIFASPVFNSSKHL